MGKYRVFKSQYGEFLVDSLDENSDFVASFDGTKWASGLVFDAYALQEFRLILDQTEAEGITHEATTHLDQKSIMR